ncbi:MAG: hypothetical protein ACK4YU_14975, partial [Paracoccus sp. (in: a-proteobacteria)]
MTRPYCNRDRMQERIARFEREKLGDWPEQAVGIFADLGLDDAEIARYFRVRPSTIARLRDAGHIKAAPVRPDSDPRPKDCRQTAAECP